MNKSFDPQAIEQVWYQTWEQAGYFAPQGDGKPYCIMIPPPNVTGVLHMGHGFQHAIMDCLTRYHRMMGDQTLWQMGTDHAGIATQMVVERQLLQEGKSRHDLGREAFIDHVWQWKAESGGNISQQMRRLGSSLDWSNERFTMDDGLSHAVQKVFIKLYEQGLIYRGKRLVNWDPTLLTAISDLEVVSEDTKGTLWHIHYPLADGSGHVTVATTRPETMLGDVAVAVNPKDERYQHLIGKQVELPLTDRTLPIIADEYVDAEFGTGFVKITPAHDFNDYAVGQRHQLPLINVLTADAKMNDQVPTAYQGLDRFSARKQILKDLKDLNLLGEEKSHDMVIPKGDRSGDIIEPFLTDQWYVKAAPLAEKALQVVKEGRIKFIPENWTKTYNQWLDNIEDWCISRQLWWGHRVPAWYDEQGNIYVGESEAEVREKYSLTPTTTLRQDEDVLDTWFSSALWPFSTLGWPEHNDKLKTFYPTSVLVTGFDIIFFWVARMVMMGMAFLDEVPFKEVYITGLIRDAHGNKMSKSKGNVLDPIDLIDGIELKALIEKNTKHMMQPQLAEKAANNLRAQFPDGIPAFGTDALRFTFLAQASTGRDIRFDMGRIAGYRNFCNKIWNAARFVLMNTEGCQFSPDNRPTLSNPVDLWMQSRLQKVTYAVHKHFKDYRFDQLANELHECIWHEFCDWYLELTKPALQSDNAEKQATQYNLLLSLEICLRLLHPLMPFITEEIWQRIAPLLGYNKPTIMLAPYPSYQAEQINTQAEDDIEWLKAIINSIRNIRGEMNISPAKKIQLLFNKASEQDKQRIAKFEPTLYTLAKIDSLNVVTEGDEIPPAATGLVNELEICIPLAGLIDKTEETQRLNKAIQKLSIDIEKATKKLANPGFTAKAPKAVVTKEQALLEDNQKKLTALEEKLADIKAL